MGQIFHPAANPVARASIFGAIFMLGGLVWALSSFIRSPYITQVDVAREQPIPFSHKHHVEGLGIDCRYCHTSVEESNFAGMPSTSTCMNCHSVIWNNAPILEPLRQSFKTTQPVEWVRVNDLPDFVYFNHSIHVQKGVACATCHGPVNEMPLMRREHAFHMSWCLSCHRDPEKFLRPKDEVFNMHWKEPGDNVSLHQQLMTKNNIRKMTDCTTCHR